MILGEVFTERGRAVFRVEASGTLEEAVEVMVKRDTSGLIVEEEGRPAGILTRSDILDAYVRSGRSPFSKILVRDAMTNRMLVAGPEDPVPDVLSLMTRSHIEHLPVVEEGRVTGMLLLCDLVEHQVGHLTTELHHLEDYLSDLQEGVRD